MNTMNDKPKILVVDDKPENLVAIERVLQDLDVELIKATSGNDALKATLYHDFALALLDIQMPGMDGYELAAFLREEEKTKNIPFIFISAVYTDNFNVFKGYETGAFSFITKPFREEILVNKVKFFVEKHQQEILLHKKNLELQTINRELEAFSYTVSHDLRAPLRALTAYSSILEEDFNPVLNDEGKQLVNNIRRNARKMGILIDDLLAFSRLGRQPLKKQPVNMDQMVKQLLEEFSQTTPHQAKIEVSSLPPAFADPSLIYQVWMNLISNAIKYSGKKEQPLIRIFADSEKQDMTTFVIQDNGTGFDMKYVSELFGVFQRLHHSNEFEGTGIGLAIVQRIVHKHGGSIWCEAEEGKGATFYFTLPGE